MQAAGVDLAAMKFKIDLKRLIRIFDRLTLLEQPDGPVLRPDAIGSGFGVTQKMPIQTIRTEMPDSGPARKIL